MNKAPSYLPSPPTTADDRFGSVSVPSGGAETTVATFRTRVGLRCFVVALATNTEGSPSDITWNLKVDGSKFFPYADFNVSPADPSLWDYLPWPLEIPQNAEVSITARNAGAATVVCTGRVVVMYTEQERAEVSI